MTNIITDVDGLPNFHQARDYSTLVTVELDGYQFMADLPHTNMQYELRQWNLRVGATQGVEANFLTSPISKLVTRRQRP